MTRVLSRGCVLLAALFAIALVAGPAAAAGVPVAAAVASPPRQAVLVLDTSGSMQGSGIAAARAAALTFADRVPAEVRIALVTFAGRPQVVLSPTTDRAALRSAVNQVTAGGNTSLYDGILTAVAVAAPAGTQQRLIVLSDGDDTTSTHSLHDVESAVASHHAVVDVIRFRGGTAALNSVAAASGGRVLPAADASQLAGAFSTAAGEFTGPAAGPATPPTSAAASAPARRPAVPAPAPARRVSASATSSWSPALVIALGAAFVAILGAVLVATWTPLAGGSAKQRKARLAEVGRYRLIASGPARPDGEAGSTASLLPSNVTSAALTVADRAVRARGSRQKIVDSLDRAGLRLRAEEWVVLQLSVVLICAAALTALLRSPLGVVLGAIAGYLGLRAFLSIKAGRRASAFEAALPDMLQLLAGSVRSGFSLNQAVLGVVSEGAEPVSSEFARALTEVRLGADLEDALEEVAQRMGSLDLHLVLLAVRTSREVGGNLAEVLMTTAETMRDRSQVKGQVKVLSAEGRLSARVLIALPFVILAYLVSFRPQYLHPLVSTHLGWALIAAGGALLVVGAVWIRRMVRMEV